ncbi:sulfatase-like hydrolase/transferase [Hwangdonia lutea]|uniref:Sulfatase-like hydrolase/transferase n=1 Tax=Hwangdonia lutea TaxID=3075823 RepID=A0AA97EJ70_9FLAO|nr:sulfatase-like hydrolase/transferase [Hwangdonia sp. SCSIO 19198]WOD42444.1 sulfatase-like hydrolase/transferase [Hwangdonia sp. SCSIO 19198]
MRANFIFLPNKKQLCLIFIWISLQCFSQNKPNVIIIYTDDQGAIDLGCYGASDIHSPNIDKLAKQGTRFTQAYVAAPVCAPSRAALLTGKYPQNAGVEGNTSHVPNSHGMPNQQYTLAELFKDNGYKTGHIGKWHLGMSAETSPNAQGFDYSFGHLRGCIDNYSHYFFWAGPNVHDLYENGKEVFYDGQYFPDLASDRALKYVEDHKEEPFFMYYAINMPHYPYQPTDKWRDFYKDVEKPRGDYAAFISTIDERIGFLMDKLDMLGIRDNTIIVYQSDNGHSTETRAFNGGGNAGPYRGAKSSLFEGGIRLPTIISWKNNLPHNVVNHEFFMNIDWLPTLAKLCNFNLPKDIDGLDLSEMIKTPNTASQRTGAFWKYGNQWAVRNGNWKLMGYPKDTSNKGKLDLEQDALFLSNLDDDISEMKNLASQYPEMVEALKTKYLAWEHGFETDIPKKTKPLNHLGINAKIKSTTKLNNRYKNIEILIDGKRGFLDFGSGQWIGQEGGDLEFILDLNEMKVISEVTIGYLHNPSNWVFSPKFFEVAFSNDGVNFSKTMPSEISKKINDKHNFSDTLSIHTNKAARFIKLTVKNIGEIPEGHAGVGNLGWFFIDEIIIK